MEMLIKVIPPPISIFISTKSQMYQTNGATVLVITKTIKNGIKMGRTKYFGINFTRYIDDKKEFSGYYRYTNSDMNLKTNSTNLLDTSFYTSKGTTTVGIRHIIHTTEKVLHPISEMVQEKEKSLCMRRLSKFLMETHRKNKCASRNLL